MDIYTQHGHAWTYSMDIDMNGMDMAVQHIQYMEMDLHHGLDMQHGHGLGHAAWSLTCSMDMDMQNGQDMHHGLGHAQWTWACSMDMDLQHGHGHAWTIDRYHGHEHAA
jgi:hypothetical protein